MPRFLRRSTRGSPAPRPYSVAPEMTGVGHSVFLERISDDRRAEEIVAALAERYEIEAIGGAAGPSVRIFLPSAVDPNEAVVKLACALDEIDPAWERVLGWPRATQGEADA